MRKTILSLALSSLFFSSIAVSQKTEPKNIIMVWKDKEMHTEMIIAPGYKMNRLDTFYMALLKFIAIKVDSSILNEKLLISRWSDKGVGVLSGSKHNIFFAITRKNEQVVLIEKRKTPKESDWLGGQLKIVGDDWVLSPDGQIQPFYNFKPGVNYVYIGAHHGRFEIPKDIWQTEYDDGY